MWLKQIQNRTAQIRPGAESNTWSNMYLIGTLTDRRRGRETAIDHSEHS